MNNYAYSPSRDSFYPIGMKQDYINAGSWPEDVLEVTDSVFEEYGLKNPPEGMRRAPDENGMPSWEKIPPIAIERLRDYAINNVNNGYNDEINEVLKDYPSKLLMTLDRQEREARVYSQWESEGSQGSAPDTRLLSSISSSRQMKKSEVANQIIEAADKIIPKIGYATGRHQSLRDKIDIAFEGNDRDTLESIQW